MSKEMNMVDYFNLPVTAVELVSGDNCILDGFHECISDGYYDDFEKAAAHAINNHDRLNDEVEALREALRLKEAECEALASSLSRIVSAAADAHLSGSEQQHVDHLYRVIRDASGKLYSDESRGNDENQQAD